jgi:hypothetical protein
LSGLASKFYERYEIAAPEVSARNGDEAVAELALILGMASSVYDEVDLQGFPVRDAGRYDALLQLLARQLLEAASRGTH